MKKYLEILRNCKLFESIEDENLLAMLKCLRAEVQSYSKNQYIFTEGETASHMGNRAVRDSTDRSCGFLRQQEHCHNH